MDPTAITGAQVLTDRGDFVARPRLSWGAGTFSFDGEAGSDAVAAAGNEACSDTRRDATPRRTLDGRGLWVIPGLVDAHAHAAWHAFDAVDREHASPTEQRAATIAVLRQMLAAGFTSVRDAGGLVPAELPAGSAPLPRVQASVALIDPDYAASRGGIHGAVEEVLTAGARWVKIVGTRGVASPPGAGLDPLFTATQLSAAVDRAAEVGAGVMLHAWGGRVIDDAIEAGVQSIEHGIFLTDAQARRAAAAGLTFVPTLTIYRDVLDMIDRGELPAPLRPRVEEAVAAHPAAVRRARDAGLAIALGSDYSLPWQHGRSAREVDALVEAGLTPGEALLAASRCGAALMARASGPADPADAPAPTGHIAVGEVADAVILRRDPREPGALLDPKAIVAVVLGGRVIAGRLG